MNDSKPRVTSDYRTLKIHIGMMKAGSTSIQHLLSRARQQLAVRNVYYPDTGQINHMMAVADLLRRDSVANTRMPAGLIANIAQSDGSYDGLFDELAEKIRDSSAHDIIISAENLVYAGPSTIEKILSQLEFDQVEVLLTTRPISQLLSSHYQQLARIARIDSFEPWARQTLDDVAAGSQCSSASWLRPELLLQTWAPYCRSVNVIPVNEDAAANLESVWEFFAPSIERPPINFRSNPSHPAASVMALQHFIRDNPALSTYEFRQIQHVAFRSLREAPDYAHNGRFALKPEVATLIDEAATMSAQHTDLGNTHWQHVVSRLNDTDPITEISFNPAQDAHQLERTVGQFYARLASAKRRVKTTNNVKRFAHKVRRPSAFRRPNP